MPIRKLTTKDICNLGVGIALYVVLGLAVKIPLIGHIQSDLGYIAFGLYCVTYGPWGAVVGAIGCVVESMLISGWFPIGWLFGQIYIGVVCGFYFRHIQKNYTSKRCIVYMSAISIICIIAGIGFIKTAIECTLYSIPFEIKFTKNMIATVADAPLMVIGIITGYKVRNCS